MGKRNVKAPLLIAVGIVLMIIWGNSLLPASVSGQISGWLANLFAGFSGAAGAEEGILRKLAHVLEFAALGAVLALLRERLNKPRSLLFLCGMSVALIDETLQLFSVGRSGMVEDVWIDMGGFCLGVLSIYAIRRRRRKSQYRQRERRDGSGEINV